MLAKAARRTVGHREDVQLIFIYHWSISISRESRSFARVSATERTHTHTYNVLCVCGDEKAVEMVIAVLL